MATFERRTLRINGIETVLLEGGEGPTLVFLHGAGTVTGFDFAPFGGLVLRAPPGFFG